MIRSAKYWIDHLKLEAHPEGGFYKETYRSSLQVDLSDFSAERNVSTGIYFLLTGDNFSAFHRIKSDEMWHFYAGDPIHIFVLHPEGQLETIKLGLDLEKGEVPQAVIPANCWFASRVNHKDRYGLVGCTVAPGFDFEDFEMADRTQLIDQFPAHKNLIQQLTRV